MSRLSRQGATLRGHLPLQRDLRLPPSRPIFLHPLLISKSHVIPKPSSHKLSHQRFRRLSRQISPFINPSPYRRESWGEERSADVWQSHARSLPLHSRPCAPPAFLVITRNTSPSDRQATPKKRGWVWGQTQRQCQHHGQQVHVWSGLREGSRGRAR